MKHLNFYCIKNSFFCVAVPCFLGLNYFNCSITNESKFFDQRKILKIHTATSSPALHPWFITGFTDGEGCFSISIIRKKTCKLGWEIKLSFNFSLHKKDKALLENIQTYFGVGNINTKHGPQSIQYSVQSIKDLVCRPLFFHFRNISFNNLLLSYISCSIITPLILL